MTRDQRVSECIVGLSFARIMAGSNQRQTQAPVTLLREPMSCRVLARHSVKFVMKGGVVVKNEIARR